MESPPTHALLIDDDQAQLPRQTRSARKIVDKESVPGACHKSPSACLKRKTTEDGVDSLLLALGETQTIRIGGTVSVKASRYLELARDQRVNRAKIAELEETVRRLRARPEIDLDEQLKAAKRNIRMRAIHLVDARKLLKTRAAKLDKKQRRFQANLSTFKALLRNNSFS